MKKLFIILSVILFSTVIFAQTTAKYLIKIDRKAAYGHYRVSDVSQLALKLPAPIIIYHTSANYLLAGVNELVINELPRSAYTLLDEFPLTGNWYLLTRLKGQANLVSRSTGEVITEMDQTILLRSNLTDIVLGKATAMPYVRLDFNPLPLTGLRMMNPPQSTRVDFGNLLSQVNADSIMWFIQQMQNMGTRYVGAPNSYDVSNWMKSQFQRFGYTNAELDPFLIQNFTQWNAVAKLTGTIAPNKVIVIGGHHDSVLYDGNDPMLTAPGADDNASGTAAVLEMARVMKVNNYQPECTIMFATLAAEEVGLWGSRHIAQEAQETGQDIKIMINHDMISNSTVTPGDWYVCLNPYEGFEGYSYFAMAITASQTTLTPYAGFPNSAGSDSYSFWQRGFPSIYFEEDEFSPFYHTINDVVTNISPQYVKEVIKASTAVAVTYDQTPSVVMGVVINDTGTGNSLQASWSTLGLEPDVVSYKVYVTPDLQVTPLEYPTTATTFIIPNLILGQQYYVAVAAFDSDGNGGLAYAVTGTPHIVPETPIGFNDMPNLHAVILNWSANQELDIAGYRIYRATALNGPYTLMNNNLHTTTSYEDTSVADLVYYYYKLSAVDTAGNESLPTEVIRTRALTFNQGILIVDETRNNTGNTVFAPNDTVSDQFFDTVLHDFQRTQFDTETDGTLKLADMGIYSSIFWHGNDFGNMSYPYLVREEIRKYVQAGGKIMVSSYLPTQAFDNNNNYPFTFEPGNFMYDNFGIQTTAYDNRARFKYALPGESGFPPLTVDILKTLVPLQGHIYTIESIGAAGNAQNIYFYGSDYADSTTQGVMNDLPVGVYYQPGLGKTIMLSFPLYNMYETEVTALMNYVFSELFGETVANEDNTETPSAGIEIGKVYPNPFNASVQLEIRQAKTNRPLEVSVYNIKGQKVKTLFAGIAEGKALSRIWDGKDEQGNPVSSSIYFVKATQGGKSVSRKLIKLN
jgi:hypothetical protein